MSEASLLSVLIIDDDRDTAETTAELLKFANCNTSFALSGEEGLEIAAAEQPDVVLLDIRLPGLDGCEVARRLIFNSSPKKPPVLIALTGCSSNQDRVSITKAGFHLHLVKPVDPAVLIDVFRAITRTITKSPSNTCWQRVSAETNERQSMQNTEA